MSMKLPFDAEKDTLSQMIALFLANSRMCLLAFPVTITNTTDLATLVGSEATFSGYSRYHLAAWSFPVIDGINAAASTTTGSFTPTGGGGTGSIYGYWLMDSTASFFYGAEAFGSPVSSPTGVTLAVTLTYQLLSLY